MQLSSPCTVKKLLSLHNRLPFDLKTELVYQSRLVETETLLYCGERNTCRRVVECKRACLLCPCAQDTVIGIPAFKPHLFTSSLVARLSGLHFSSAEHTNKVLVPTIAYTYSQL
uniref:Uncharacterized protein n=1 Tax=Schistocephalus solidus TaxID=70667 RepID=A0A0V0J3W2_SCHSO